MQNVYIILYEKFTALDAFGPVEVFGNVSDYELHYVSLHGGTVTSRQSLPVETEPMSNVEPGGIILIPGGPGSRTMVNENDFLMAFRKLADEAEYVLSVCTGAAIVAKTGVLDGRLATSNKRAFDWVVSCGEKVNWVREARWVADGKFYTSAGVSAGIDMTLGFVKDRYDEERADEICRQMEYHWHKDAAKDLF